MPSTQTDQGKLAEIIRLLSKILRQMDNSRNFLYGKELRGALHHAWLDFQEGELGIARLEKGLFQISTDYLLQAGLSGTQLTPKYLGFLSSYNELKEHGGIRRLKSALRWSKTILGSIATIVPVIKESAEIVKEFIEAAEIGIEKAEQN